jgi:pimeloyl-ACP methyl ester carboxylesterase
MDGTGFLFEPLVRALEPEMQVEICAYPTDEALGYDALEAMVRAGSWSGEPTIVVAESFSGHIAVRLAADPPSGLVGVVLAATFVVPPAPTVLAPLVHPALFGRPPPAFCIRAALVGWDAPDALVGDVAAAIACVHPEALAARLRAVLTEDSRAALARAAVPIVLIRPTRDRLVWRYESFGAAVKTASIDAPHLVLQRCPERCAQIVEELSRSHT